MAQTPAPQLEATRRTLGKSALIALAGAAVAGSAAGRSGPQGLSFTRQPATSQQAGVGAAAGQKFELVHTIQELTNLAVGGAAPHAALVLGYTTVNDGGGGLFAWAPLDTQTPDGGTVFASSSSPTGRWLRLDL